jgi:hypothetical protein
MMNRLMNSRGPHFIDGEIDHGLTEGVRGASTIVIEDPLFDDFAYGGNLKMENERYYIIPRDGVRRQLHFKNTDHHFKMILDTDGFLKEQPIVIKVDLTEIDFRIENRSSLKHKFKFSLSGLPLGNYDIYLNGKVVSSIGVKDKVENKCKLEVGGNDEYQIGIRLNKN